MHQKIDFGWGSAPRWNKGDLFLNEGRNTGRGRGGQGREGRGRERTGKEGEGNGGDPPYVYLNFPSNSLCDYRTVITSINV